ncbi:MAG TPA: 5'-nucleotidase C-terminal domain-containing protein, partial [Iamia sp.]|nr:5'-nucleotidase C-terminal domain-containing protein [Iamia sp.]
MPRPGRRAVSALLLVCASLGALLIAPLPASAAPVQIQLLAINDFHGRLEADAVAGVPGVAKVATLIDTVSTEAPTSFAAAGDLIGASPFVSAVAGDEPSIEVLNLMGLDASSVGNHEFDKGYDDLHDRVEPLADFPYLGANVRYADGEPQAGERALDAYAVVDVGGIDVGYVGVVTEQTPTLVSPDGIAELDFTDPVAEAEDVAADLKDGSAGNGEADVVVVLTHEGADPANIGSVAAIQSDPVFGEFVDMSENVDAIFSGHTHQPYAFNVPIPGSERTRPVISAQEYGKKVGRVKLTVDTATDTITTDVIELLDPTASTEDPDVKAIVDAAKDEAEELGSVQIGEIDADILRAGDPPGADRGSESDLGNFIADALLAGTAPDNRGGAEIAFMNAGGLRDDFRFAAVEERPGDADGVVTYSEGFAVQSFTNDVVTRTYTGAQIDAILEQQWQPTGASRPLLWLGVSEGFSYTYNPTAPKGYRVNDGSLMLNGTPIEPDDTFRVTLNSFLAAGGDNFPTFTQGTESFTTGDTDLTVLRNYFESFLPDPVPVDREPRSAVAVPEEPDLTPFEAVADAVTQQFMDLTGAAPTEAQQRNWEVAIYTGARTLEQLILELQYVDILDPAAKVTRIYLGLYDRPPSVADLAYWVGQIEGGRSLNSVASFFARSAEFVALYGDATDEDFVELVYQNVLGRAASPADLEYWLGELDRGVPRYRMFLLFSESPEFRNATVPHLKFIDLLVSMLG